MSSFRRSTLRRRGAASLAGASLLLAPLVAVAPAAADDESTSDAANTSTEVEADEGAGTTDDPTGTVAEDPAEGGTDDDSAETDPSGETDDVDATEGGEGSETNGSVDDDEAEADDLTTAQTEEPADRGGTVTPLQAVEINLLAINDFHGRLFDYDEDEDGNVINDTLALAGTIEELRAERGDENTIFLTAGDDIGASLFTSALQEDRPTIEFLNALDLDAAAVGNHEFDAGYDNLVDDEEGVANWADFPHLGANVRFEDGSPALEEYHVVEDVAGLNVAIIGAVTQDTPNLVIPSGVEGLVFEDPVAAINRVVDDLVENDAADVIVASLHEGAPNGDSTLAEQVALSERFDSIVNGISAEVDAIFNGHTHQLYAWDGPIPGAAGEFRPVVQNDNYGTHVGQVVLTVDGDTGDVLEYSARNVPVTDTPLAELLDTYPRVVAAQAVLDEALEMADEIGSQVIGSVTADITTAHIDGNRDDRSSESTLGNLVGNMLRDQLSAEHLGGAEIGVTNPGGLRAELLYGENGDITFAEANAVLPFLNDLWTVTLTGAQFVEMLEQQWPREGRGHLHLGLSDNVSYTFDPDAGEGERITSVMIDGQPLDPAREYRIGTFSFLAEGGDHFSVFRDSTDDQYTAVIDREAWIAHIEENSPLSPDFARRATVVDPLPGALTAGEEVSFEVRGLDLTSLGSPANTELEAYLVSANPGERGEPVATFDVADGAAAVSFTVPADLDGGEYYLDMVANPSGTEIRVPVTITAETPVEPVEPDDPGEPVAPGVPGDSGEPDAAGAPGAMPSTGADLNLLLPALLILLAGGVLVGVSRSRRRQAEAPAEQ